MSVKGTVISSGQYKRWSIFASDQAYEGTCARQSAWIHFRALTPVLASMRIRIQLFTSIRIRSRRVKPMRIHADPDTCGTGSWSDFPVGSWSAILLNTQKNRCLPIWFSANQNNLSYVFHCKSDSSDVHILSKICRVCKTAENACAKFSPHKL